MCLSSGQFCSSCIDYYINPAIEIRYNPNIRQKFTWFGKDVYYQIWFVSLTEPNKQESLVVHVVDKVNT